MIQLFARYFSVGVINTLLHWVVFAALVYLASTTQATANLIAFIVAVTFSFFANAKFTFKK
ncbi:translocase, partial [Salmonella enterica subsp. enterica serovar Typhimurium]|nr:translocase [Salmonella enterica subsp. enterica serovar Typhimurium]